MNYTPSQLAAHEARKARHYRIAMAQERFQSVLAEAVPAPIPETKPDPIPEPERISAKHKPLWFTVVSSIKLNRLNGPPIRDIQRAVCALYGVSLNDLLSVRRQANIVLPRQVAMYLAKELTTVSYGRIAYATGNRDHTTAIHAHRKIEALIKSDEDLAAKIALIKERIG